MCSGIIVYLMPRSLKFTFKEIKLADSGFVSHCNYYNYERTAQFILRLNIFINALIRVNKNLNLVYS